MLISHHPRRPGRRAGFTLVELLVAAAISILIMVIITGAFQAGLDTFRKLRAQGNLQERLRMARTTLGDDLSQPHFQTTQGGWSKLDYLSNQDLTDTKHWKPPSDGFFRIWQADEPLQAAGDTPIPFIPEGTDSGGLLFTRARTHAFAFTIRRRGAGPENMFRTMDIPRLSQGVVRIFPTQFIDPLDYRDNNPVNGQLPFVSQWAEVAWFMAPNGASANGTPLFNLYRRQELLIPAIGNSAPPTTADVVVGTGNINNPTADNYNSYNPEISSRRQYNNPNNPNSKPYQYHYNRTGSVTDPRNRFGMLPAHNSSQSVPNGPQTLDPQLAGLPDSPSIQFKPYLPLIEDLRRANSTNTTTNHGIFDSNDLVLSDVLSFEVKVLWDYGSNPKLAPNPTYAFKYQGQNYTVANSDFPYDYLPGFIDPVTTPNLVLGGQSIVGPVARVFDTWSQAGPYGLVENPGASNGPQNPNWSRTDTSGPSITNPVQTGVRLPLRIKVKAVLIRIRVWDIKSEQTRQITIMQDV